MLQKFIYFLLDLLQVVLAHLRRDGLAQNFIKQTKRDETKNFQKPHSPRRQVQPIDIIIVFFKIKYYILLKLPIN